MVKWKTYRRRIRSLQQSIIPIIKNRYELIEKTKKQVNRIFIDEKLAVKLIANWKTTSDYKFRTRSGFKQYDVILAKQQSVLTKIMISFEWENMQTKYKVLTYRIDMYFHDYKLAIEIHDNGHSDKNIDYEIRTQKAIEQQFRCRFIRTDPKRKTLIFLELSVKYLDTLNNRLKNH